MKQQAARLEDNNYPDFFVMIKDNIKIDAATILFGND